MLCFSCVWQGKGYEKVVLGNDFTFGSMAAGQQIRGVGDEETVRCGGGHHSHCRGRERFTVAGLDQHGKVVRQM